MRGADLARTKRVVMLLAGCAALVVSPAAAAAHAGGGSPFAGTALWVNQPPAGEPSSRLAADAAVAGAQTLFLKAGDGVTAEPLFTATLLASLTDAGLRVCAWTFAYGSEPLAEAALAVAAVRAGASCLVVDAEGQYDGRYWPAQQYVHALRSQLGSGFPIGLAGQAEVAEHPGFPDSVFLGPGGFGYDMPQIYWRALGVSVPSSFAASIAGNFIYGRPIAPVGQLFEAPGSEELAQFRSLAVAYGAIGVSFFDTDAAEPAALAVLARAPGAHRRLRVSGPALKPGADGDQVVWLQELLNASGARLPVGGFYGPTTAHALARFQSQHHLARSGLLSSATWKALLRLRPREPSWQAGPPASALESL